MVIRWTSFLFKIGAKGKPDSLRLLRVPFIQFFNYDNFLNLVTNAIINTF